MEPSPYLSSPGCLFPQHGYFYKDVPQQGLFNDSSSVLRAGLHFVVDNEPESRQQTYHKGQVISLYREQVESGSGRYVVNVELGTLPIVPLIVA